MQLTKIYQLDPCSICEQNILPLDISVQHTTGVQIGQPSKYLPQDVSYHILWQSLSFQLHGLGKVCDRA